LELLFLGHSFQQQYAKALQYIGVNSLLDFLAQSCKTSAV
jgi:hypothetical protein